MTYIFYNDIHIFPENRTAAAENDYHIDTPINMPEIS
jgi:hypothetical protein